MGALLAGPYGFLIKYGAIALVAAGLYGFGYYRGHENAVNSAKVNVVNHVEAQTTAIPKEDIALNRVLLPIVTIHDKVYVDVVKTVPDLRACDIPAAGVGLLDANRGALPATP